MQITLTGDPNEIAEFIRKTSGICSFFMDLSDSQCFQHHLTSDEMPKHSQKLD